jgi:YHS domain-containing protein
MNLIKLILYALLAYGVYMIIRFFSRLNQSARTPSTQQKTSGVMVKDETCNTYLPKEDAIKEIHEGKEYFFCSDACRQKFLQSRQPR